MCPGPRAGQRAGATPWGPVARANVCARAYGPGTGSRPGRGSSGGGSEACAAGAGGSVRGSALRACVCVRARVCARAQACVSRLRAGGGTMLGALRWRGSWPASPPPAGPVLSLAPGQSAAPSGLAVAESALVFFPPAPEAVPIAGANEARPLGSAPEVIGLGSERSPHGGHCRCSAAVPTTFFFFL